MKNFFKYILIFLCLSGCESDEDIVPVALDNSIIPNNAVNVSLRPAFGFTRNYGGIRTKYTIYCETTNPPLKEVAFSSVNYNYIMSDEDELLKPNTTYYWYCNAEKDGQDFPTDIFTFTTVDTSVINGQRWVSDYVLSKTDYENQSARDYYRYDLPMDSSFIYGEPYGFTVVGDSVKNVNRSGDYSEQLPTKGEYYFTFDKVSILDWEYQFINLGTNFFDTDNNLANKIHLVLKQPYSNNVVIFREQE